MPARCSMRVQHQDAEFVLDRVAVLGSLRRGAVQGDRDLARLAIRWTRK